MESLLDQSAVGALLGAFARLAGWVWFDPVLGRLPRLARLFAAAALAVALWPRLGAAPQFALDGAGVLALTLEFATGALLALIVQVVLAVVLLAFGWLRTLSALEADGLHGEEEAVSDTAWRALALWLATLGFLAAGGHLLVVDALIASFEAMPVAAPPAPASLEALLAAGGWLFFAGLKLALPVLVWQLLILLLTALALRRVQGGDPWALGLGVGMAGLLLAWIVAVPLVAPAVGAGIARMGAWLAFLAG